MESVTAGSLEIITAGISEVIVASVSESYQSKGVQHELWGPIAGPSFFILSKQTSSDRTYSYANLQTHKLI